MTPRELNQDVKRLVKHVKKLERANELDDGKVVTEILRLYRADDTFEYMSKDSVLKLLRLNLRFRAVPLHTFGVRIEL